MPDTVYQRAIQVVAKEIFKHLYNHRFDVYRQSLHPQAPRYLWEAIEAAEKDSERLAKLYVAALLNHGFRITNDSI